jgi:hypothetical protein
MVVGVGCNVRTTYFQRRRPTMPPTCIRGRGAAMAKVINCQCGRTIRGESEEDVISQAEGHVRESHPDLVGTVTRDQLREWVEDE